MALKASGIKPVTQYVKTMLIYSCWENIKSIFVLGVSVSRHFLHNRKLNWFLVGDLRYLIFIFVKKKKFIVLCDCL